MANPAPGYKKNPDHHIRMEPSPRRVRVQFGGEWIADTTEAMLLYEVNHLPVYYFPLNDVRLDLMHPTGHSTHCPYKGDASYWTVEAGGKTAENAVWAYREPFDEMAAIRLQDYCAFYWNRMDRWYEEDEEVFVHPRDPYKRVDVIRSSRHVQVVIAGETVADTQRPYLLLETGLPTRYYIPQEDVRMELLEPSRSTTRCPYKGVASYWSLRIGDQFFENIVWSYLDPIPECSKVKGLMSFYNEKVDLYVDGELQPRPATPWS